MEKAATYFLNLFAQSAGRICTFGANLFIFILIARMWGTELFGQYSYILTFLGVITAIADFGMTSVLGKDLAQVTDGKANYWGNYLFLRSMVCLVVIVPSVIAAYYIRQDLFIILMAGSLALPFLASRFFEPFFQVYQQPWHSSYASVGYALAYLLLSCTVVLYTKDLLMLVVVYILANSIYLAMAMYLAYTSEKPRFEIEWTTIKDILKLAVPLGVSSLFTIVSSKAAIFILAAMKSDHEVAIFNAAYKFLDLGAMLAVMLVSPIVPILSTMAMGKRENLRDNFADIMEIISIFALPVAIVCPFISQMLIELLYGNAFQESAMALNILAWVGVLVLYSLFTEALAISIGVVNFALWSTAIAAVMNILLNYFLIPRYSFIGSAWAALICEIFLSGVTIVVILKHVGNIFRWRSWAKIIILNLAMFLLLGLTGKVAIPFAWGGPLVFYILSVILFKAIPPKASGYFTKWRFRTPSVQ